jgi:hypothetical protein
LNVFEAWEYLAAWKSQALILRVNEQLLKLKAQTRKKNRKSSTSISSTSSHSGPRATSIEQC